MIALHHFDLPESFIRRYRPVRVTAREKGVSAYLFDEYGLRFYRQSTTAEPVPADAVWSVIADGPTVWLRAGEYRDALSFLISERRADPTGKAEFPLPRRLTYRQRVQCSILESLIRDLAAAPCHVPTEVMALLRERLTARSETG